MNHLILYLSALLTTSLTQTDRLVGEVSKNFSDKQIRAVERRVLHEYKIKVVIKVIKRDEQGTIINLDCKRFDKEGKEAGGCSSDNFGRLVVTKTGCRIADVGYEDKIE